MISTDNQQALAVELTDVSPGLENIRKPTPTTRVAHGRFTPKERRAHVTLGERLVATSLFGDIVAVVYALVISFWLRFRTGLRTVGVESNTVFADYAGYIVLGTISLIAVLAYLKLYDRKLLLRFRQRLRVITKGVLLWLLGFLCVSLLLKFSPPISRGYVLVAGVVCITFLFCWRFVFYRFLLRPEVAAQLRQRVLLVGWNDEAARLTASVAADSQSAYQIVGCVRGVENGVRQQQPPRSVKELGGVDDIPALLEDGMIDMVILSDVDCLKGDIIRLANLCEREMIQFKIMPSYFQILVSGLHLELLNTVPVLGVSQLPLDRFANVLVKRICDIVGALVGLALGIPFILLFGALVWLESPGPIFYRQRRLGRRGLVFNIYKIRSMRIDTEKDNWPLFTKKDDPRRLKIGAFLRRWNIDELPQFWNVLKGDMSLVGPRPELLEMTKSLRYKIPHYNARHNVKPGITGWAQVKGHRGDTDLAERISCDLYYLENWNVFFDFQIMAMTFFKNPNAC